MPLLLVWHRSRPRSAATAGFVAGVAYHGVVVSWAWYFGAVAIVPFVAALSLYWAGVGAAISWLARRRLRHPLLTAAVWVTGEALVARWPLDGFSWGEVGYAFHDVEAMRALGALGGLPLISFVAVAINAALADAFVARWGSATPRAGRDTARAAALIATLLLASIAWAVVRPATTAAGSLRYALVQGNDLNRELTTAEELAGYLPESHFRLAGQLRGDYDLIVFPESVFPDAPNAPDAADLRFEWPQRLGTLARAHNAFVLANGTGDAPDGRALNLDVMWGPDGREVGTYAKRHLVPYGERVPLRSVLQRFIGALDQIPRDYAPGDRRGLFDLRGIRIATVICFESMFGAEVRPLVDAGAQLIVVSTNNRSYRRSANSDQHVAASQIRAVETGRPVLHAAISGVTAVVDTDGRIVARRGLFENGVTEGEVIVRSGRTPYVVLGEWVVLLSLLAVAGMVAVTVTRSGAFARWRRRSVDSPAA